MSLPQFCSQSFLFSTAALSASLFPETDRYRLFARLVYPCLAKARSKLAACYCADNGRIAVEPVLLLGVSVLQFVDGLPDRAAVEMLRYHAGWNFALNRQLGDPLFHPTTLVNFRDRLLNHSASQIAFQTILDGLVEAGLVSRKSRQRLDSTQVFGLVARMSRLECVRETLRLALEEMAALVAEDLRPQFWTSLWERYVENKLDYRAESGVLARKMNQAGADGAQLLGWLDQSSDNALRQGEQVTLLKRVWQEHFDLDGSGSLQQRPAQPPGAVHNPHEPEAQWAAKGQGKQRREHVGYKVQVAETVSEAAVPKGEPTPNFITAAVTQPAIGSDDAGLPLVEQEQSEMGLQKPSQWYVDGAYVSAERLVQAQAEGREIIGPAQPAPALEGRFNVERFDVSVEQRRATCPEGKASMQCSRLENQENGKVHYRFEFSSHCHQCPVRQQCLGKDQKHRTIVVGQHHTALQNRRKEQRTEPFKLLSQRRNAIEGTQSELVRAHGLRRARYRGLAKMALQTYLAAAACNVKRWMRRAGWTPGRALGQAALENAATVMI